VKKYTSVLAIKFAEKKTEKIFVSEEKSLEKLTPEFFLFTPPK